MPQSAEEVHARIAGAVGPDGRLPLPPSAGWANFPWEVADGAISPKQLPPPADDPGRFGETPEKPCEACAGFDPAVVAWEDDTWVLTHPGRPTGSPVALVLHPREHVDMGNLDDELASQLGRISNRLVRIVENLPNIGRVHVSRSGDGGSHLRQRFYARTARLAGVHGSQAVEWDDIIPPGPADVWRADLHTIATKLANWGGEARL